ncbi:hypothetical protein BDW59DRAFT_153902 [Aspergillus cavernicola]|uniref:Enoyl reductase (ER) domain-containing protein n=1 Tax=Aspergillus cavernicola TaxID=176166 RepID=A0ABR4HKZ3_9EURO
MPQHPQTMQAHFYTSTTGGLEKNLTFTRTARTPPPPQSPSQVLIRVLSVSLNPADYKVPEQSTLFGRVLICRTPASPGIDFCGRVEAVHESLDDEGEFHVGDLVLGCLARPREFGSLAEFTIVSANDLVRLPAGVRVDEGACVGVSVRTAWQALKYYGLSFSSSSEVSSGPEGIEGKERKKKRVFINGGSGGCGVFAIQFAKMLGCHVTVTCSSRNEELVRGLGADEVIDYTSVDVLETLIAMVSKMEDGGGRFDHVIDHIGLPSNLYTECHQFLKAGGAYVQVGAGSISTVVWRTITPRWFGGGRRRYVALMLENSKSDLEVVAGFLAEKKIRVVVDSVVGFSGEEVVAAYEKLRSGRARGKIIVRVAEE